MYSFDGIESSKKKLVTSHVVHNFDSIIDCSYQKCVSAASPVAQWLRVCLPMQGDTGSSPGPGGSHMPRSN